MESEKKTGSIYTIGHGRRSITEFIGLVLENKIDTVVDVRSIPFSRFNPQYNQKALSCSLGDKNIAYVFMGDSLGGRPKDKSCYDDAGNVDYSVIKTKEFFKTGIAEVKNNYAATTRAALLCSESDPAKCHRCKLIGEVLDRAGYTMLHIDQFGKIRRQNEVLNKKGSAGPELFPDWIISW